MRKCIWAVTITGSCALLYLLYHLRNSRKKHNSKKGNKDINILSDDKLENNSKQISQPLTSSRTADFDESERSLCNNEDDCNLSTNLMKELDHDSNLTKMDSLRQTEEEIFDLNNQLTENDEYSPLIVQNNCDLLKVDGKNHRNDMYVKETKDGDPETNSESNSNECNLTESLTKFKIDKQNVRRRKSSKEDASYKNAKENGAVEELSEKVNELTDPLSKSESLSSNQIYANDSERELPFIPEQENGTDAQSSVSQASFDSGQGSLEVDNERSISTIPSESTTEPFVFYHFKVPQFLVGRLIGKKGALINKIKSATSTDIFLVDFHENDYKLCSVEGNKGNVAAALDKIRDRFPLDQFPDLTMDQLNTPLSSPHHQPLVNKEILQLDIPPGVVLEVQVSSVVSSGEVWLQQPLHPTFSALPSLNQCLNENYGNGNSSPGLSVPIPENTLCVCQISGQWFRCQVLQHDDTNCTVTLLDVGGTISLPISVLRQIRTDYMSLPFQATRCFIYGIEPCSERGWTEQGRDALMSIVKNDILYATIAAYSEEGIPLVNLHQRKLNEYCLINKNLVEMGHAKWMAIET